MPLFLIISLDRTPERWERVKRDFFNFLGFKPKKISAVDGQNYVGDIASLSPTAEESLIQRPMSKGEVACYLSHAECWKALLQSHEEWALVMEDDIHFVPNSQDIVASPDWIPEGVDIVQVGAYKEQDERSLSLRKTLKPIAGFELIKMFYPMSWGTQAYWINRRAAKKALEISDRILGPVDHFLFDQGFLFAKSLNVYTLNPFVVYQKDEVSGSLLEKEREEMRKLEVLKDFRLNFLQRLILRVKKKIFLKPIVRKKFAG